MKQNRNPVNPVVKEDPVQLQHPLPKGLDLLFEAMQLIECQGDALIGAASTNSNLNHLPYLNIEISQKVQEAYENLYQFQREFRALHGGVL